MRRLSVVELGQAYQPTPTAQIFAYDESRAQVTETGQSGRSGWADGAVVPAATYGSIWRRANQTLAGRSASRRMYHGYQYSP